MNEELVKRLLQLSSPDAEYLPDGQRLTLLIRAAQEAAKALQDMQAESWALEAALSTAIGSNRFMDPPDGGDVWIAEQVDRMRQALEAAEKRCQELEGALEPFVKYTHEKCFEGDSAYTLKKVKPIGGGWYGAEDLRRARAALEAKS